MNAFQLGNDIDDILEQIGLTDEYVQTTTSGESLTSFLARKLHYDYGYRKIEK